MKGAVSANIFSVKNKSSQHKLSYFISRNNNSKGSKNSEHSLDLGFTEESRPLHKVSFSDHCMIYTRKIYTLLGSWLSIIIFSQCNIWKILISVSECRHDAKLTYLLNKKNIVRYFNLQKFWNRIFLFSHNPVKTSDLHDIPVTCSHSLQICLSL